MEEISLCIMTRSFVMNYIGIGKTTLPYIWTWINLKPITTTKQ